MHVVWRCDGHKVFGASEGVARPSMNWMTPDSCIAGSRLKYVHKVFFILSFGSYQLPLDSSPKKGVGIATHWAELGFLSCTSYMKHTNCSRHPHRESCMVDIEAYMRGRSTVARAERIA